MRLAFLRVIAKSRKSAISICGKNDFVISLLLLRFCGVRLFLGIWLGLASANLAVEHGRVHNVLEGNSFLGIEYQDRRVGFLCLLGCHRPNCSANKLEFQS